MRRRSESRVARRGGVAQQPRLAHDGTIVGCARRRGRLVRRCLGSRPNRRLPRHRWRRKGSGVREYYQMSGIGQTNAQSPEVTAPTITSISAVTLATHDMPRAVRFYRAVGFMVHYGGEEASFTSFHAGSCYMNLIAQPQSVSWSWWGRIIFLVSDVDAVYARVVAQGLCPETPPRDAEWGERYFHLRDPDGHELSFAKRRC
jgi:catechol 2,3-dioxygenase-like lactoylglutathione lyase family enzyme